VSRPTPQDPIGTHATDERVAQLLRPDVPYRARPEGYLDTLPGERTPPPGLVQALWQTGPGSLLWQTIQWIMATASVAGYRGIPEQLRLDPGHTVADIGCGPGNVTTGLAEAVGPHGLAVGADLSAPMLTRATAQARPNMGLLRADATRLPLRDGCVDAACATAVVMLVPDPASALAELVRITTPGGWLLVMVPTRPAGPAAPLTRPATNLLARSGGARLFASDELPVLLEKLGCDRLHSHQQASMLTVRARLPPTDDTAPASNPESDPCAVSK
jgi:SAM-dependent methyltransferase